MKDTRTRAQKNRAVRQEALRQQLANQKHLEHVIDIANKLRDVDDELDQVKVTRLKYAADIKLNLIDRYLPKLKNHEITGEGGEELVIKWRNAD